MVNNNTNLTNEIRRLALNCMLKREMLQRSGILRTSRKKGLSVLSGVLALLSAGAIASVLVKYFGNESIQILAALSAFVSGILTLVVTIYYTDDETSKILEGSSKYLDLRERISNLNLNPAITDLEKYASIVALKDEYYNLDNIYSQYETYKIKRKKIKVHVRDFFSAPSSSIDTIKSYGYSSMTYSPYDNIDIEETFRLLRNNPDLRKKLKLEFEKFESLSQQKT